MRTKKNSKKTRMTKMNSEISIENRKAMSIPQKGAVFNSAILLESQCNKESNDIVSYQFLFKRTAKRPDLLTVLNNFSKGTRINLEDGDYLIKSHDYTIKSLKKGIKVTGSFSTVPVSLSNPHVKQMTALEDFDHEYSKMEMTQPETYFRVYPYQNFNGPAFRAKLFSYVSTMGENYGYCDDKSLYYRRASLVMPKIKITKAIPQAKMMFHTHPKRDEPSISSPDDYLLYFDLSHKPRNIRHFYTVMADRMDYFHITPKHDKKNDYVKIDEDKFIEKLDKKMDEIAKKLDEKLPSKTAADDLYYCEKITKEVVKWLNKEYSKYFKIKYKCHYRVKRNPDKDMGEDLHLGDAFLAKALNDIKSGSYTWPEFDENSLPHEKYAFWYSLYYAMNMDRNGAGYSRVLRLHPGDIRRLHYFGNKRFEGTQFDYYDIINILLLNYDISMADAKVRDGTGTTSRIEEILDFLEVEEEIPRDNLILLTQVLEQGIHSDEARTTAGDHYFILPLIEACVLGLQSIEDVKAGANYELKKHELMVHSEKAGNATAQALGDLYNKTFVGTSKSLRPNPSLKRQRVQYNGKLPKHSMANVELIQDILKEFAPSRLDMPQDYKTERGQLSLRVKVEEEIVTIKLTLSSGNMQIFSNSDEAAIEAVRKVIEVMKPYIDFTLEDDIDNIGVITNEPVRNPKNAIIISVASPIQKTKNEVLTSLEKRLRDSTIATTYTTRTLREYEKRPHIVEVSDDMYNRLVSNGDIIMGISYGDSERRGYKRSDFEKSKYVLVDTMIRDQDLLSRANSSIISFYLHPTNSKGNVEYYLKNHVSPQEAKKVASLLDYLRDMASGDTFDHVIEYDINKPSFVIEEVFKEVPKSNPKGPDPLEQTIFGDGSSYLTAQTIPITALQNLRTGTSAAPLAGPPLLNPKQPSVITISGPSGVGKTTIIKRISKMTGAEFVPSVTTRPLRPKEKEGVDKFVVTKERFEQMIANEEFVEHRKLKNGHYYGRRYSDLKDLSIVDVTLKGKNEFEKKFPNTFSIFLKPNVSADVLASHMRKRGGMSESERKGRADIIERMLESASKMDFDLVITSRVGEYEKVAEEIVPQLPQPNPKKYKGKASVVISRSTKKDKKLMAVFNFPDGRKKTTHFGGKGYSDYTIHNDKDRKKRYDTRHSSREDWDDFTTAGALSKWILWNKPSLIDSFNHYKAMFSLDGAITVQTSQAGKIPASRNPNEVLPNFLGFGKKKEKKAGQRDPEQDTKDYKNFLQKHWQGGPFEFIRGGKAVNWKELNPDAHPNALFSTEQIGAGDSLLIYDPTNPKSNDLKNMIKEQKAAVKKIPTGYKPIPKGITIYIDQDDSYPAYPPNTMKDINAAKKLFKKENLKILRMPGETLPVFTAAISPGPLERPSSKKTKGDIKAEKIFGSIYHVLGGGPLAWPLVMVDGFRIGRLEHLKAWSKSEMSNKYKKAKSKTNPSKTPEGRKIPKRYLKGLNKEEMIIAAKEIDKGYKYDIDDPKAYEYWKSDIKATARGYKTVPSKYKKKFIEMYGPLPEEGKFLDKMAKATKIKKSILEKVYDKGLAAWRGGHRPGVQQHQWAAGRVYSFVTLGNTVMKGKKKMPDHSLAVEAGLIKENPSKGWDLTMEEVDILAAAYRDYNTVIIGKKALKFERFGTVKIPTSFDEVETPSDIVTSAIRKKNFFSEDYFPMFFNSDLSALTAMKMQAGDSSIRIKNGYNSSGWRTWAEPIINTTAYHLIERQDIFDLMLDTDFADTDYKVSQICKNKDGFYLWDGKRRIPFDSVSYAKLLGGKGQFNVNHSSGNDKIFYLTIGLLWVKDSLKVVAISFNKDKKNPPDFEFSRNKDKRKKRWDFVTKSPARDLYRKAKQLADKEKVFFETQELALREPVVRNVPASIRDDFLDWYYNHTKEIMFWLGSKKSGDQIATLERRVILKPVPKSIVEFVNNYDTKHRSKKMAPKLGTITRYILGKGKLVPRQVFGLAYFGPNSPPKSSYPIMLDAGGGNVESESQFKGYYGIVKLLEAYYMETNGIEGYGLATSLQRAEYYRSFGWLMPLDMKYSPYIHKGPRNYLKLEDDGLGWDSDLHKLWRPVYSKAKKNPGWRHGEQMEDDPFAEYFEENVEGDENTTTA
jgi:guanylate kinase